MSGATSVTCPLCGGPLRARYHFGGGTDVVYCHGCRLGQLSPTATDTDLAALYASRTYFEGTDRVGYADYAAAAPEFSRTFRKKLQMLLRYGPIHDLLEVGCGPGYFLSEAHHAGVGRVLGVDPNPWAAEQAHARGVDALVGSIEAVAADRRFDAVVMLDVIEHITQPLPFLTAVRKRLRPDGRVLIMTPNICSLLARLSGPNWVSFKIPEHVSYYSPRSIRLLLERAGFVVERCRGSGQYVRVAFVLDRLGRLVPRLTAFLAAATRATGLHERVVFVANGSIDVVARVRPSAR